VKFMEPEVARTLYSRAGSKLVFETMDDGCDSCAVSLARYDNGITLRV
jgi:hypothetical protein